MNKYIKTSILILILVITSCETNLDLEIGNRKVLSETFKLVSITDKSQNIIEKYSYNSLNNLSNITFRSIDNFNLTYSNGVLDFINTMKVEFDRDKVILQISDTSRKVLEKTGNTWRISKETLDGTEYITDDFLEIRFDENNNINSTFLNSYNGTSFYYYDAMINPYQSIHETLIISMLSYPLNIIEENIAFIGSTNNVVRFSKMPRNSQDQNLVSDQASVNEVIYNYTHPKFDVPVKRNLFPDRHKIILFNYNE